MQKKYFGAVIAFSGLLAMTTPSSSQEIGRMFCDSLLSFLCPAPPPPPPPVADVPPPMAPPPAHVHKVHKHKKMAKPMQPAEAPAAPQ